MEHIVWIYCSLIFFIQTTTVQAAAVYQGCYKENIRNRHFQLSPGNYVPTSLKVEKCTELCGAYETAFASLTYGKFCFCGDTDPGPSWKEANDTNCDQPCTGDASQKCGGNEYLSVYVSSQPINSVTIQASVNVVKVGDPVSFTVMTDSSASLEYQMDYGDGNGQMAKNATDMFQKTYYLPGRHDITVTASDVGGAALDKSSTAGVDVQAPVKNIGVECPIFITDKEDKCVLTIEEGTRMQVEDTIDGVTSIIDVADPIVEAAGCCVPSAADTPTPHTGDGIYVMYAAEFTFQGVVTRWEMWADTAGTLTVMILNPVCPDYCYDTNSCGACTGITCTPTDVFCPRATSCSPSCTPLDRHPCTPGLDYAIRQTVTITVPGTGYNVLDSPEEIVVFPGDVIAYARSPGSATLTVSDVASECDSLFNLGTANFAAGSATPQTNKRHHLRAIYTSKTKVYLTYTFTTPGPRPLQTIVKNLKFTYSETNDTTVEVLEGINATIISSPTFIKKGVATTFTIMPQTGTNVKQNWDMGDGTVDNDRTDNTFIHTYNTVQQFVVTVISHNALTNTTNTTTVTVQEEITGFDIVFSACEKDVNCPFKIQITTGSDYFVEWDFGDGVTQQTTAATSVNDAVINHIYNTGGDYTVTIRCHNEVSTTTKILNIKVQAKCEGLALVREGADKNVPFKIEWTLTSGSDCVFTLTFDGANIPVATEDLVAKKWATALLPGKAANEYLLDLNVTNALGSENITVMFTIEVAMTGVLTSCDKSSTTTGNSVTCSVTMTEGTNVECIWDFDDGTVERYDNGPADWALLPDTTVRKSHVFTLGKVHEVNITCSNKGNTISKTYNVLVVVGVGEVYMVYQDVIFFSPPGYAEFSFETTGSAPNAAQVSFDFGDDFTHEEALQMSYNYSHQYRDPDCYTISARIWNAVDNKTFDGEMCVIDPVENMRIEPVPPGAIVNQDATINIVMYRCPSGRHANLTCDFNDGNGNQEWQRTGTGQDGLDTRTVRYTSTGTRTISCTVTTPLQTETAVKTISVDHPVIDCTFTTNEWVTFPNAITYTVTCPGPTLPTNAKFVVDPGDGSNLIIEDFNTNPKTISHTPLKSGHFIAKVTLRNDGTSLSADLVAGAYEPLTTISYIIEYEKEIPVGKYEAGLSGSGADFPINRPIRVSATVAAGTAVDYLLTAKDPLGTSIFTCNSTTDIFICDIPDPGEYDIEVIVRNPISVSTPEVKTITMRQPVGETTVQDITPKAKAWEEKKFNLTFDSIGENSCLMVNFGTDPSRDFAYGAETDCNAEFPQATYSGPLKNPMVLTMKYESTGDYVINATLSNNFSNTTIQYFHSVSSSDCSKPQVSITDGVEDFRTPMKFEKSKKIIIRGKSTITCATTLENNKTWTVVAINEEWGNPTDDSSIMSTKAELVIKEGDLDYGLYKATYQMEMLLKDETTFMAHSHTFFEVTSSPLVVVIEEAGISEVDRGINLPVTFKPEVYSFDPDIPSTDPQGFTSFTWKCETLTTLSSAGACSTIDGAITGALTFNSGLFALGERIKLTCTGVKNTTTTSRSADGEIVVHIVSGNPLHLYIVPAGSSLTSQLSDGKLVSSEDRLALEVRCKTCGDVTLSCEWSAYSYEYRWTWRPMFPHEVLPNIAGLESKTISVNPSLYKVNPGVLRYRFSVKCRHGASDDGKAALNIQLNTPPQPGSCVISPLVSVLTWSSKGTVNIKCAGWADPDGIAEYRFFSKYKNSEQQKQIRTFREADDVNIDPPLGADYDNYNEDVYVDVSDKYGSIYRHKIATITVRPPTVDQIRSLSDEERQQTMTEMDRIRASGEQKTVTEKFTQIATLIQLDSKQSQIEYQGIPEVGPQNFVTSFLADGDTVVADGMDPSVAQENLANEAEKRKEYMLQRDNNAQLRGMIAETCGSMESPGIGEQLDVLTCLEAAAAEPTECSASCSGPVLKKAREIAETLKDSTASAERLRSVCMSLLSTTFRGATAIKVNEKFPVLTDIAVAEKKPEFYVYDTDLESPEEELFGARDPFVQQAVNVHGDAIEKQTDQFDNEIQFIEDMVLKTLVKTVADGEQFNFSTASMVGTVNHLDVGQAGSMSVSVPRTLSGLELPAADIFNGQLDENDTAVVSVLATKEDINSQDASSAVLGEGTQFVRIQISNKNGTAIPINNIVEPLKVVIAHSNTGPAEYIESELHIANWNELFYKTVDITKNHSSLHVHLKDFADPNAQLLVVIKKGEPGKITGKVCDDVGFLPQTLAPPRKMTYMMDNRKMDNFLGTVWVGLRRLPEGFDTSLISTCDDLDQIDVNDTTEQKMTVNIYTFTSGCYFFDENDRKWSSNEMWVGEETDHEKTVCYTTHLTTFGGGWAVAPNVIDWNFVFNNADFYKNSTLYVTEIVIALVYILAVVWARRKDKKDVEKVGLTPLKDNNPNDKYYYEIVVVTSMRRNAGTESKVFVILSGEHEETDVRMLNDDKRNVFRRGGVDAFLMSVSEPLGPLNYARVWHDNSGKGKFGSWYLKYLIVRDIQTNEKFVFICNRWFAVEEDDGQVDRVIPVAGVAQMTEFGHLFSEKSRKNLVDGHLWFSVVARPPQSRFTRVQRVSCCLCLLFATMLTNAMFYEKDDSQPGTAFTFGPFAMSPQQIFIGVLSNLIVFPPTFLVIYLFRKSKARKKRPSRLEEALKKMSAGGTSASMTDINPEVASVWNTGRTSSQAMRRPDSSTSTTSADRPGSSMEQRSKKKKKKRFELPWWCLIIGWALLWIVTGVSAAFVTFYGIMFQDEKCKKWITSLLISFFTSVFVTQPIKVFLTAIFLSLVCKNLEDDEDADRPEDEEEPKLAQDEEYLHSVEGGTGYGAARPRKIGYKPPEAEELERARKRRLNEIKMWDIIREIVFYSFFVWILMVISYRNRSPNSFIYKNTLEKMIIKNNDTLQWFTKIRNTEEFWKWARSGMVNSIRASNYYNRDPPVLLRGFVGDKVSRMMGFATMRQLRVRPALCEPIPVFASVIHECNEAYSLFTEEKRDYDVGWKPLAANSTVNPHYTYSSASKLNSYPYWGRAEVYGGGGYLVELRGSKSSLEAKMLQLEKEKWIDKYTRAVFVEFTVYNAQVNLFAISTILAEFQPTSGVLTSYRFEPAMLLPYMSSVMIFQIVCEIIYVIFTIAFIVKEIRSLIKERSKYFTSFWNLVEVGIITMSIASIVTYFYRLFVSNALTSEFKRTHGNEYQKFQYAGYWNEVFSYMIGWLVFFGTLKFLKLLRFNKRMSLLASTLSNGARSILHFLFMFIIVYCAFMQLFYLTFKNVSKAFTTFINSAESGLLMMMGKFDIYGMLMVEPILTQVYVFFFVVTVTFILVNMFLSILNETFTVVRVDISKQNNDYEIVDFMVNRFKRWTGIGTVASEEPPKNQQKKHPTVEEFPDRIDRLLNSISNVYMDDNIGAILESNGESKKMAMKNLMRQNRGARETPLKMYN